MSMSMSTVDFYSASPRPPLMRYMAENQDPGIKKFKSARNLLRNLLTYLLTSHTSTDRIFT